MIQLSLEVIKKATKYMVACRNGTSRFKQLHHAMEWANLVLYGSCTKVLISKLCTPHKSKQDKLWIPAAFSSAANSFNLVYEVCQEQITILWNKSIHKNNYSWAFLCTSLADTPADCNLPSTYTTKCRYSFLIFVVRNNYCFWWVLKFSI